MYWRLFGISAIIAFGIDQISKWLVVHQWSLKTQGVMEVFPPYLVFRMGWNRGVNFGLFSGSPDAARWVLIGVAAIICALVIWWMRKEADNRLAMISAGLLVGGALANVLDRLIYGAVADFLNMSCCGITNPFSFNIADVWIFVGAVGLIFATDSKKQA